MDVVRVCDENFSGKILISIDFYRVELLDIGVNDLVKV